MQEIWRGGVNAWECDEMGHLNVRFYVQRAIEGVVAMAPALALGQAFRSGAAATLIPRDQHIRFLREARPGAPLHMVGGVVAMGEADVILYQELRHADGTPAATFRTVFDHADAKTGRPFAWSQRTRAAAADWNVAIPAHGAGRSIDPVRTPDPMIDRAVAEGLRLACIGRGAVLQSECDGFGRFRPEMFIGRVSDCVPNLLADWRADVARTASSQDGVAREAGAAVLEYRLVYRSWPRAGDVFEIWSGFMAADEKTHRLAHWILDPVTGAPWCTCEAVAITLDLIARKAIPTPPAHLAALQARVIPDLTI
jgi:acyl-CoA thioester hydrolase